MDEFLILGHHSFLHQIWSLGKLVLSPKGSTQAFSNGLCKSTLEPKNVGLEDEFPMQLGDS